MRAGWLGPMALVWLLLTMIAPMAHAERFGDLEVNAISPPAVTTRHGYVEYRVTITNRSPDAPHQITLAMHGYNSGHSIRRLSRTILVPPGTSVEVPLLQPAVPMNAYEIQVTIDGRRTESIHSGAVSHAQQYYGGSLQPIAILLSRGVSGDVRSRLEELAEEWINQSGAGYSSFSAGELFGRSEREVGQWSTNWLAYTRYDGIIVTQRELEAMPGPVAEALWAWTQAGGRLMVLGRAQVPEAWQAWGGEGGQIEGLKPHVVGFGACWEVDPAVAVRWGQPEWKRLYDEWRAVAEPWQDAHSVQNANRAFPVVEDLGIPVRGMLGLMVLFTLLIGPVNLVALSKMNRRIWLLATTPAIAALFSVSVFGYAIFAEGWDAHARSETLTLLDQTTRRATTLGWVAFYSPLTPSGGAHFSSVTELAPQVSLDSWSNEGRSCDLDWTQDQHLAAGWIAARVPAHFQLRKSERRRERLAVSRDEQGRLTVVNGLGAPIRELHVADAQGQLHTARDIAAGARTVLQIVPDHLLVHARPTILSEHFYKAFGPRLMEAARQAHPDSVLRPNTYLAQLDGAPFIEPGLDAADRKETSAVYGLYTLEETTHAH